MFHARVWNIDESKTELSIFGETTYFDNLITWFLDKPEFGITLLHRSDVILDSQIDMWGLTFASVSTCFNHYPSVYQASNIALMTLVGYGCGRKWLQTRVPEVISNQTLTYCYFESFEWFNNFKWWWIQSIWLRAKKLLGRSTLLRDSICHVGHIYEGGYFIPFSIKLLEKSGRYEETIKWIRIMRGYVYFCF